VRVLVVARSRDCRDNHLWREAQRRGVNVVVVSPSFQECLCPRHIGAGLEQVGYASTWSLGTDTSRWIRNFKRTVSATDPDLIHVDSEPWSLQVRSALQTGLPVVPHSAENVISNAPWWLKLRRSNMRRNLNEIAGLACWGITSKMAIGELFDLSTIPHAVVPACPPSPEEFPFRVEPRCSELLQIGYVGRTVPYKGLPLLISAIRGADLARRVQLQVLSLQTIPADLLEFCRREGIQVTTSKATSAIEVADFMSRCDVVAIPSGRTRRWSEQWGRVAAEAQLVGTPVLLADSGELPHMATSLAKVLPNNDVECWAKALASFVPDRAPWHGPTDRRIETNVARRKEITARFSLEKYADEIVDLWGNVLKGVGL